MNKIDLSKISNDLVRSKVIDFMVSLLFLLITFNAIWLVVFIRVSVNSVLSINTNWMMFGLESTLILGNLIIFVVFLAWILGIRSIRSILGRRY